MQVAEPVEQAGRCGTAMPARIDAAAGRTYTSLTAVAPTPVLLQWHLHQPYCNGTCTSLTAVAPATSSPLFEGFRSLPWDPHGGGDPRGYSHSTIHINSHLIGVQRTCHECSSCHSWTLSNRVLSSLSMATTPLTNQHDANW